MTGVLSDVRWHHVDWYVCLPGTQLSRKFHNLKVKNTESVFWEPNSGIHEWSRREVCVFLC